MRGDRNERLTILSEAEKTALYGIPNFDDFQRITFFAMTDAERALALGRKSVLAQVYCLLQIGYFKAKQAFFQFSLDDVLPEDVDFLLQRYFPGQTLVNAPLHTSEYYVQRNKIAKLFGYRMWSDDDLPALRSKATLLARTDVSPTFLLAELMVFLIGQRIVRPGYSTLQSIIRDAFTAERERLEQLVQPALTDTTRAALQELLQRETTLSDLAALKQDAKSFRYRQMGLERQKRLTLAPLYAIAKALLPSLDLSQLNIAYYASLANFYTIYDLRRFKPGQTNLYLLCYAWQRYRQLTDNLVEAFGYHTRQLEEGTKAVANQQAAKIHNERQQATPRIGELLLLYVDDTLPDGIRFGTVRRRAFGIMPEEKLRSAGELLTLTPVSQMDLRWQAVDKQSGLCTKNLRPLAMALDFASDTVSGKAWLAALQWMKEVWSRQQRLAKQPLAEIPPRTVPTRLRGFLLSVGEDDEPVGLRGDRYEFWVYRQLRKRLDTGDIYLDDSVRHRRFADDLVSMEAKANALKALDIPWLRQPVDVTLDALFAELDTQWRAFNEELRGGKLKHLEFDPDKKTLIWHRPKADKDKLLQQGFYAKLQARDIADIFRFVNEQCDFLSAMTPLQPRYAKKIADEDSLMAVIIAQAMNHGNFSMAETCDIPYHVLEATHQQHLRPATLIGANDQISNFIASLPIFPYYSIDMDVLYGSVDGQKFTAAAPTLKARHARKYFGKDRGVVAFTLLANHVALQTELLGANQHESYWVFDICYNNTSDIRPTTITGDMHCINMANFAILHWFGMNLAPRFTNLQTQTKHLYCGPGQSYADFLIQPVGQIDRSLIESEKANMDHIAATLGLKEMSQSVLMRKICTLSGHHRTRKAIFEFDKLIRSIYTLRYLRDPQLQRDVHRSENRIESYHQLRSTIAQVNGKKELTGRTDLDVAVSNHCGRLIANVVIAYNSMLLSGLLSRYLAAGNEKAIDLLRRISPAAWQHLHFLGHYAFRGKRHPIDLEAILTGELLGV
ncbi:Tn3 family transposase [Janthinobacterium sp. ROICE36]|uniref:Tn3 family transposase n=1 Tax=Janthinobacterium sp. ROICE36 TaxID=2048670 RepID=UPI000C7F3F83|nr:Tn3 family transposase [Janthinobacterium sp. ROICE36]PLY42151.1 Tn3 family transposase [Janthinobacterium sp. ROICE36]